MYIYICVCPSASDCLFSSIMQNISSSIARSRTQLARLLLSSEWRRLRSLEWTVGNSGNKTISNCWKDLVCIVPVVIYATCTEHLYYDYDIIELFRIIIELYWNSCVYVFDTAVSKRTQFLYIHNNNNNNNDNRRATAHAADPRFQRNLKHERKKTGKEQQKKWGQTFLGGLSGRVQLEVLFGCVYGWVNGYFLDSFWGDCLAGCLLRCRLLFNWLCVWVSVRIFFGFVWHGAFWGAVCCLSGGVWVSVLRFFGFVLGRNRFFQCNDAKILFSESKVAKHEVHSVIKKSQLAFMSTIDLYVCLGTLYYILYSYLFLVQKYPCKNRIYIDWIVLNQIAENWWYFSMLFGVDAGTFFYQMKTKLQKTKLWLLQQNPSRIQAQWVAIWPSNPLKTKDGWGWKFWPWT